jgi:hypothetical protein
MALLVKDANTITQTISTQADAAGNLVPVNTPTSVAGGVAVPVSTTAPLPVINAAGAVAADRSGTIATGGTAQMLFSSVIPTNGFMVQNNHPTATIWVSDVGAASAGGSSVQLGPASAVWATPSGYKPAEAVSIFSATTGASFMARRW